MESDAGYRLTLWMTGWGFIVLTDYKYIGIMALLGYLYLLYEKLREIHAPIENPKDEG